MSDSDPYRPPTSMTAAEPTPGEKAWSEQSLFGAFFGAALGAFIGVALWKMAVIVTQDNSAVMVILVGICVGLLVRFNGRGLSLRYRFLAMVFAWIGSIIGALFTHADYVNLILLLLSGLVAASLACRRLGRDLARSVWRFENGVSEKKT